MAKSARSKREKRLKSIRRDLVQPFYDKKDEAKLAALQAALAAPKLPVKSSPFENMDTATTSTPPVSNPELDMEMDGDNQTEDSLKPIGKKLKKKLKLASRNRRRKTKRRHI